MPVIVSIICFLVMRRVTDKDEKRNRAPRMYILKLTSKEKTQMNERKIKQCSHIILFSYKELLGLDNVALLDKTMVFKEITYKELLERVRKHSMTLLGFEMSDGIGLSLSYVMNIQGKLYEMDERIVPTLVDADTNYCLVCREEDVPTSLRGDFLEQSVQYVIKGRDHVILPRISKTGKR